MTIMQTIGVPDRPGQTIQPAVNREHAPDFDHLIYLRVFEGCNLHCEHCFVPSNPKRMTLEQIAEVPRWARIFGAPGNTILVQWHGGEPTLFGAAWMREAIEAIESNGPDMHWHHGIQTNLMTYAPDWAEVYHDHFGGRIGVSWDPKVRLLRRDRPETNALFEEKFWRNFEQALSDGLDPYLVITATKEFFNTFRNPIGFFQKMEDHGVYQLHLERITRTGYARDNWARLGLDNAEYSRNMARFLTAYIAWLRSHPDSRLSVSPFDGLILSVQGLVADREAASCGCGKPSGGGGSAAGCVGSGDFVGTAAAEPALQTRTAKGYGCWSGKCDTRFHTIDANGYKLGCTALTSEVDNPRAKPGDILDFPDPTRARDARRDRCGTCQFRPICSSGCLAVDIEDGSGECSGGYGLFDTALSLIERRLL